MKITDFLYKEDLPKECIEDCSAIGSCDEAVEYWQKKLNFEVDRENAITCLKATGAWSADELNKETDTKLAQKVLWIACGDFNDGLDILSLISY